jgi:hypothetical protein
VRSRGEDGRWKGEQEVNEVMQRWAEGREAAIASMAKLAGRACGNCTLCCKLISIDTEEITKPANKWCEHCEIGKGCGIYAERPTACRTWSCMWLTNPLVADYWFPAKSKMVLFWAPMSSPIPPHNTLEVHVDPSFVGRWREEPWFSDIRRTAKLGLDTGKGLTCIVVGGVRRWLVLPNKEVPWPGSGRMCGMIMRMGDDWEWLAVESEEKLLKMQEAMQTISDWSAQASAEERMLLEMEIIAAENGMKGANQ